jgi:two-component system cell cycle response regulator CtrA
MRVLLIEDDSATAQSIALILRSDGHVCEIADLGAQGLEVGLAFDYDVIVLDLMLPDISGYDVLSKLRAARVHTPILILSALSGPEHKAKGQHLGANDYMTKPFHKGKLVTCLQALVDSPTAMVSVNLTDRTVEVAGRPVHLTDKEFDVLKLLWLHRGTALSKQQILTHIYDGKRRPGSKIVDVFVCRLRKKLARAAGGKTYIETIRGEGYLIPRPGENLALRSKRRNSGSTRKAASTTT